MKRYGILRMPLIALVVATLFSGCATTSRINRVSIGMTKAQVIAVMGQPSSTSANAEVEYLVYQLSVGLHVGREGPYQEPYYVRLRGGQVDSYGRVGDLDSTKDPTLRLMINR